MIYSSAHYFNQPSLLKKKIKGVRFVINASIQVPNVQDLMLIGSVVFSLILSVCRKVSFHPLAGWYEQPKYCNDV